jgi:hypothetical protein
VSDFNGEPKTMKTAYEVAIDKLEAQEIIPLMTHELSSAWNQPDRSEIALDDKYALMTRRTFDQLNEYSASNPTGAYEGKMWKRHDGKFDYIFLVRGGMPEWLLCWYGRSEKPGYVSNNSRKIILVDGELPA